MSKIILCAECGKIKAVRGDASVCGGSSTCRVSRWRKGNLPIFNYTLRCDDELRNGLTTSIKAKSAVDADERLRKIVEGTELSDDSFVFVRSSW